MHARPRFFAKVMGELLFWVGEDKMLFGSDYGIWEPKWQVEGLVDWDYPDETFSDYPAFTTESKKKILGLNAAALYDVEVPTGAATARRGGYPGRAGGRGAGRGPRVTSRAQVIDALGAVYDPELDEPITSLRFVTSCEVSADGDVDVRLRLPTPQCAPNFAYLMAADARDAMRRLAGGRPASTVVLEDHYTGEEINAADRGGAKGSLRPSPARPRASCPRCASLFLRKALVARQSRLCESMLDAGATAEQVTARRLAELPGRRPGRRSAASRCASGWASRSATTSPAFVLPDGRPIAASDFATGCASRGSCA